MKPLTARLLFWSPRVLALLFAVFIGLFALDVFDGRHGFWRTMAAFLMHLIPTGVLLLILALAWRWEWIGALLYPALGLFYLVSSLGRLHWSACVVIAGPLFVLGLLFLLSWRCRLPRPLSG